MLGKRKKRRSRVRNPPLKTRPGTSENEPVSRRATEPFFIVGPTASGKSSLALALARRIRGEIVNADAFQLYSGLDIVTAKPSAAERESAPHHLFDVLPLSETCDAHRFERMASPVIAEIVARGRVPLVVGGSGLYIKALTHGFSDLPQGDPALRQRLAHLTHGERVSWLLHLDPRARETVALANPRYVERALEICLLTGRAQSELRTRGAVTRARGVVLSWEREALCRRINERVLRMVADGLVEEVRGLGALSSTTERAIGVREARAFIAGECSREEMIAAIQRATRRYAKRQVTWFKRERWLQTICLGQQITAESAADIVLAMFPDLAP